VTWEFRTDPAWQEQLDWAREFVATQIEPLTLLWPYYHHVPPPPWLRPVIEPLKQQVRERGLWACHLGPELGGQGYGQVKLALLNEILGRSHWAPVIFGTQGPDTGNAEILAHYGTPEQKARYLQPLLDGEVFSCFAMTEPHAGADPRQIRTRAVRDGDEWVIDGEKFFASNVHQAAFIIAMAVTNPGVDPVRGMSMFLIPAGIPGLSILRPTVTMGHRPEDGVMLHPHVRFEQVRVPGASLLGGEGNAFVVAQTRLGGGRVHHSMRAVGQAQWAFDMMCERALSRTAHGTAIADKQLVQDAIAESWTQIQSLRLLVLQTAWQIDDAAARGGHAAVRGAVAAIKNLGAKVVHDVVQRSVHVHGALGISDEMPLADLWQTVPQYDIWDGPGEVHVTTLARQVLKGYQPAPGPWPTEWLPAKVAAARERYAAVLAQQAAYERDHPPGPVTALRGAATMAARS
jgi:acyl-CoA dehydrogenase